MADRPARSIEEEDAEIVEAAKILLRTRRGPTAEEPRVVAEDGSDEEDRGETDSEDEQSEDAPGSDDSDDSAIGMSQQRFSTGNDARPNASASSSTVPGSVLPQGQHWKCQQPMAQPLGYRTAADANGGERTLVYAHHVDFNSRESVNTANKARAREVYRARQRFDLPLARPSMLDRLFTQTHMDWLAIAHEAYGMLHDGALIPWNILTLWWRFCWRDDRTEQALRALYSRIQEFKDLRAQYG